MNLPNKIVNILKLKNNDMVDDLKNLLNIKENLLVSTKYSNNLADRDYFINKISEIDNKIYDLADIIEEESNKNMYNTKFNFYRGQIILVSLGYKNKIGSEQQGLRPCVIVQNNLGNIHSPNLIVSPLTSRNKNFIPTHVKLSKENYNIETDSIILCEQLITISKDRCYKIIDKLNYKDTLKLNDALKFSIFC